MITSTSSMGYMRVIVMKHHRVMVAIVLMVHMMYMVRLVMVMFTVDYMIMAMAMMKW